MKNRVFPSEYSAPAEEFTRPPEQRQTLNDRTRYPGGGFARKLQEGSLAATLDEEPAAAAPEIAVSEEKKTSDADPAQRQSVRKRSLLLQFAAAASSVVLVTNSFGIDFLGHDGLFNDSVILSSVEQESSAEIPSHYALPGYPFGGDETFPVLTDTEPKLAEYAGYPYDVWIAEGTFNIKEDGGWEACLRRFPYLDERCSGHIIGPIATFMEPEVSPLDLRGSDETIWYDQSTNTLTLHNYSGEFLQIHRMGSDITIRLEGRNELSQFLFINGGSVHLTGNGSLITNKDEKYPYGVLLRADYSGACLMIDADVNFDFYGKDCAVCVEATSAEKPIWLKGSAGFPNVRQAHLTEANNTDGSIDPALDDGTHSYYTWYLIDRESRTRMNSVARENGASEPVPETTAVPSTAPDETYTEPATTVPATTEEATTEAPTQSEYPGLPVGGDSEFPELPNLMQNTYVPGYGILNEDYIELYGKDDEGMFYLNPTMQKEYQIVNTSSPQGLSYDPSTNTLTMNNYHGGGISANLLGNGFTVVLIGENELEYSFIVWGFYTGGSVTFTGDGSLAVNTSGQESVGLMLRSEWSTSCVMIDRRATLDIQGIEAAVAVVASDAEKAVYYRSKDTLENVRQVIIGSEEYYPYDETTGQASETAVSYPVWSLCENDGETLVRHLHIDGQSALNDIFR